MTGRRFQAESVAEQVTLLAEEPAAQLLGAAIGEAQDKVADQVFALRVQGSATIQVVTDVLLGFLLQSKFFHILDRKPCLFRSLYVESASDDFASL